MQRALYSVILILIAPFLVATVGHADQCSEYFYSIRQQAQINFLPSSFKERDILATSNLDLNQTQRLSQDVINLKKIDPQQMPTLQKEGLSFVSFKGSELEALVKDMNGEPDYFLPGNRQKEIQLRKAVAEYLESIKDKLGIDFDLAIPMDTVYRSSEPDTTNPFKPIKMAHIDFEGNPSRIFNFFRDMWASSLGIILGYKKAQALMPQLDRATIEMVHIWFPINNIGPGNTLALADKRSVPPTSKTAYTAVRRNGSQFEAIGIKPNQEQKWYYSKEMSIGDAYVFLSREVPHTAIELPSKQNQPRKSIEVRVLLVKSLIF